MTDRANALIVVLEDAVREDDLQPLLSAIAMLKGVLSVDTNIVDVHAHIAKRQAQAYYRSKLIDLLTND